METLRFAFILKVVFKVCTSDQGCGPSIPYGTVLKDGCIDNEYEYCTYFCDSGYQRNVGILLLSCSVNGEWVPAFPSSLTTGAKDFCIRRSKPTTISPAKCPMQIPNGYVSFSCNRKPDSTCLVYYCNGGCRASQASLFCSYYGDWIGVENACSCSGLTTTSRYNVRCPYLIPNGYISDFIGCEFTPFSVCNVVCNSGCVAQYTTLYCGTSGDWYSGDEACRCEDPTTTTMDTRSSDSSRSSGDISIVGVIGGVVAIMAFIVIACLMCGVCRRLSKPPTENSTNQPIPQTTTTTSSTRNHCMPSSPTEHVNPGYQQTHESSVQSAQQEGVTSEEQPTDIDNYLQGPPPYSEIFFIKPETVEAPPSYEEVTTQAAYINTDRIYTAS